MLLLWRDELAPRLVTGAGEGTGAVEVLGVESPWVPQGDPDPSVPSLRLVRLLTVLSQETSYGYLYLSRSGAHSTSQ